MTYKKIVCLMLLSLFCNFSSLSGNDSDKIDWLNLAQAQELSRSLPKPILIDFTAAWCGWCKKMDKTTFLDQKVIEALSNDYYAVKVDFDDKSEIDYQGKKYNGKELAKYFGIEGLPTFILISSDFKKVKAIVGYKKAKQFAQILKHNAE